MSAAGRAGGKPQRPAPTGGGKAPFRKPPLRVFPTTLWEYPSQHYGASIQGDRNYVGATPSWVIWQLLTRYTRESDLVVDPMCGSGTTLDVARELGRRALGFDVAPTRDDISRADARSLPLEDSVADFVFIDPPYSTHIRYSDDPACIGKLSATEPDARGQPGGAYFGAMAQVFDEAKRALRNRRCLAVYVSDSYRKRSGGSSAPAFAPIGFELFALLRERFVPLDIVCVKRGSNKISRGSWRRAAVEGNFYLRGFNYLFICKKQERSRR